MLSSYPPLFLINFEDEYSVGFDSNKTFSNSPFSFFSNDILAKPSMPIPLSPVPLKRSESPEDQIDGEQKPIIDDANQGFLAKFFSILAGDPPKKIPKRFTFSFGDIFNSENKPERAIRYIYSQEAPMRLQLNLFHLLFHTLDLNSIKLILQYTYDESDNIKHQAVQRVRCKTI